MVLGLGLSRKRLAVLGRAGRLQIMEELATNGVCFLQFTVWAQGFGACATR